MVARPFRLPPVLLVMLLLVGCGRMMGCSSFEYERNQRLTVTVETPDGEVTGSGVVRSYYFHGQTPYDVSSVWRTLAGEYPVLDLGERRYLVAVMGAGITSDTDQVFTSTRRPGNGALVFAERPDNRSMVDWVRGLRWARRNRPRPVNSPPLFVTFDDPDDPLTVRRVDVDEVEAVFGPGHRIASITIELTRDAPTEGAMREAFPWMNDLSRRGVLLDGQKSHTIFTDYPLANKLGVGSFYARGCS